MKQGVLLGDGGEWKNVLKAKEVENVIFILKQSLESNLRSLSTCVHMPIDATVVYEACVLGSKLPLFPYNRGWSSTQ